MQALLALNFHHLQYFWAVAKDGNLTRTAARLRVAQSALSAQIRQLEDQVGQPLFAREGRRLELTEAGKIALVYAEDIFAAGGELVATMKHGRRRHQTLRIGAVATLSRNFQRSFVKPVFAHPKLRLQLTSGSFEELLAQLERHELDAVLSNRPADAGGSGGFFRSRRLARQPASLVSARELPGFRFPADLAEHSIVLPGHGSELRSEFDALCARLGARLRVVAEVDDMATMRLLARDSGALALVPSVVVRDELREGRMHEVCELPDIAESFYAITANRRFEHPMLAPLLERKESELLEPPPDHAPEAKPARATKKSGPSKRGR